MALNLSESKQAEACEVHGAPPRSGDRMLAGMVLACFALIAWHVWTYGAAGEEAAPVSFPVLLGHELWDLLFNNKGILAELREVFPYFLIGVLIAGYLRTYKIAVKLQASLRKYGVASVFLASFVGIITPLCACGTVTTAMSLLMAGIPLAPVMALMVASPLLSPSTYLLTLNDLGPEWTVVRTLSALAMGIFAGLVTHLLSKRGGFARNEIMIEGAFIRGDFHDDDYPDERLRCNCRRTFGNRVAVRTGNNFLVFLAKSSEMLWVVGKYVIVGVVVGAIVERYLPGEWIYRFFGEKDPLNAVWVTLASVPVFVHQISASSIIHHIKGSLDGTMDGAAALAFMIGGPVTAVPTMVLFWTFFRKKVFLLYMFVCLSGTLLITYTFQFLLFVPGADLGNPLLRGVGSLSGIASSKVTKDDPNLRMVFDPAGEGVIATYSNDVDGWGSIVFDASPERFTADSALKGDTGRYIVNVANWLHRDAASPEEKKILVYDLAAGPDGRTRQLFGASVLAKLREQGFTVKISSRNEAPRLSQALLAEYGQLWLFFGTQGGNGLTDDELQLIAGRNSEGKATLIVPEQTEKGAPLEANRLALRYGVRFLERAAASDQELQVSAASGFLNRVSEWLGMVLKLVNKA